MPETIAGIQIPDSTLAREATELVRDCTSDLIYHHSRRTFIWGALRGLETGVSADPELHYVGAMFHDLGLTQTYRTDGPALRDRRRRPGPPLPPGPWAGRSRSHRRLERHRTAHHPGDSPPHEPGRRARDPRRRTGRAGHRL